MRQQPSLLRARLSGLANPDPANPWRTGAFHDDGSRQGDVTHPLFPSSPTQARPPERWPQRGRVRGPALPKWKESVASAFILHQASLQLSLLTAASGLIKKIENRSKVQAEPDSRNKKTNRFCKRKSPCLIPLPLPNPRFRRLTHRQAVLSISLSSALEP